MMNRNMILRSAFWSGRITYRKWRGIVRKGPQDHMRVFVQSFLHLPMDWLIKEIGEDRFIHIWPEVRKEFDAKSPLDKASLNAWDALWGMIAAGDYQYPVSSEIAHLPRKRCEVLKVAVCNPGISIYDLAKKTSRNYSRVYKDVQQLIKMGEIEVRPRQGASRKAKQLIPVRSINARLALAYGISH